MKQGDSDDQSSVRSEKEIFLRALEINDLKRRESLLDDLCSGDRVLRQAVEALLRAHSESEGFTVASDGSGKNSGKKVDPLSQGPAFTMDEKAGDMIGPYKLLEKLGEGGFGVVWAAEQKEPVRRRVALKIIKLGMDTKEVVARFEAERQALALMDHPNIAKVFDAGSTETGRPYFVMELVRGTAITDYCNQEKVETLSRIDLVMKVCKAIQHAHQKGVIHRDIKPSNVMITLHDGVPVPKVIDFGIAKATQQELTEKTIYTQYSQFIGTPAYMSPEQAEMSGLDIDTRSDIYSIGVLLYELLTGVTPFDAQELMQSGLDEMRKIIREREPIKPSTRISGTQENVESPVVGRRPSVLASDLDWIVMKCLEKDRGRRYEAAADIAMDLKRHLDNEPVVARPPSNIYKLQKAWRRNRLTYSAGMAVSAALVIGLTASVWQATIASRARDSAIQAREAERELKFAFEDEASKAIASEKKEAQLRVEADKQKLEARRQAYAADMLLCQKALGEKNLRQALLLLNRQQPEDGEIDLRGWEWRHLWQRCQPGALTQIDTGKRLFNAVFTPDGKHAVTRNVRGKVSMWNLLTGKEDAVLQDDKKPYLQNANSGFLCASRDSQWVAAVNKEENGESVVRIWDVVKRVFITELTIPSEHGVSALAFSPDKKELAVLSPYVGVSVWEIGSKTEKLNLPFSERYKKYYSNGAVCFSPNGSQLAIGAWAIEDTDDKRKTSQVRLVNSKTGVMENSFLVSGYSGILSISYSPKGKFIAVGCGFVDPRITIWDRVGEKVIETLEGHSGFVSDLAFSSDGATLASSSGDQTVKLWRTDTWQVKRTLVGHSDGVWSVSFSSDGKKLISSDQEGYLQVWNADGEPAHQTSVVLPKGTRRVDVSPDGKSLVLLSKDGGVQIWAKDPLKKKDQEIPAELGKKNLDIFWISPDEILLGQQDPTQIQIWNIQNQTVDTFPIKPDKGYPKFRYLSKAGKLLISVKRYKEGAGEASLTCWDVTTKKAISTFTIEKEEKQNLTHLVSEDGKWLMLYRRGAKLELHNLLSGEKKYPFKNKWVEAQGLAVFSQGQKVAAAFRGKPTINVWDITAPSPPDKIAGLQGHNLVISGVLISPDEQRMLTTTIGKEPMKLWSTTSWREVGYLEGSPGKKLAWPRFLSDGNTIAAAEGGDDEEIQIRLWHAPTWEDIKGVEKADPKR